METLAEQLKREEGLRLNVYRCPRGYLTVGYGHRCEEGDPISLDAAEALLKFDIARKVSDFYRLPREWTKNLNRVRRRVVCHMIFQLGLRGTLNFKRMWTCIHEKNFEGAAHEMIASNWFRQTPRRVDRLQQRMRSGVEE